MTNQGCLCTEPLQPCTAGYLCTWSGRTVVVCATCVGWKDDAGFGCEICMSGYRGRRAAAKRWWRPQGKENIISNSFLQKGSAGLPLLPKDGPKYNQYMKSYDEFLRDTKRVLVFSIQLLRCLLQKCNYFCLCLVFRWIIYSKWPVFV